MQSLRTAASQLHMNVVIMEQSMQDAMFGMMGNVVMLDEDALPIYAGAPNKASSLHVMGSTCTSNHTTFQHAQVDVQRCVYIEAGSWLESMQLGVLLYCSDWASCNDHCIVL